MQQAFKQQKNGSTHIIPILVRPVYWKSTPLERLKVLPDKRAVVSWTNSDEAWVNVVKGIESVIQKILSQAEVGREDTQDPIVIPKETHKFAGRYQLTNPWRTYYCCVCGEKY